MDAQKRIQNALRRVDVDIQCGVYKRLSDEGRKQMDRIMYDFLTEYTKLLNYELDYSRSGDWISGICKLTYRIFHILPFKQKKKKGGGSVD